MNLAQRWHHKAGGGDAGTKHEHAEGAPQCHGVFLVLSGLVHGIYIICVIVFLDFLDYLEFLEVLGFWTQNYRCGTLGPASITKQKMACRDVQHATNYDVKYNSMLLLDGLTHDVELLVTANDDYLTVLNLLDSLNTLSNDVFNTSQ